MLKKVFQKIIVFLISVFGMLNFASNALALELTWPPSPRGLILGDTSQITDLVRYFYEWGVAIGGIAAFIALVWAGFQYLTSAGDPGRMKDALDRIRSAVLGLVLLLASYLILNFINPQLTTLEIPRFEPPINTLRSVDTPPPINFSQKCDKVVAYSQPDFGGESVTVNRGDKKTLTRALKGSTVSMKFIYKDNNNEEKEGGFCQAKLYDRSDCGGDNYILISMTSKNISQLGIKDDQYFRCIKVD